MTKHANINEGWNGREEKCNQTIQQSNCILLSKTVRVKVEIEKLYRQWCQSHDMHEWRHALFE